MKHLKSFESVESGEELKEFLHRFENYRRKFKSLHIDTMNWYEFPMEFEYEFSILYFIYKNPNDWKHGIKTIDNRLKNNIKKYVSDLIVKEIENDNSLYGKLDDMFIRYPNWESRSRISSVYEPTVKYIFFAFNKALKRLPEYIKQSYKFNL